MIATTQKNFDELYSYIKDENRLAIIGCGLCATTFQTGGEKQVEELKVKLESKGKEIVLTTVIEAVCDERQVRLFINKNREKLEKADGIIIMSCGAGVQAVKKLLPEKSVHPALDTNFLATEERLGRFYQYCSMCGECRLELTNGVCVITRCPKGYINGPCGGSKNGKCEAYPENDCVWHTIYNLDKNNFMKKHKEYIPPKNYKKQFHPQKVELR